MNTESRNLFLILIEKSTNTFGHILGLSEEDKLKTALSIIHSAIQDSFDINSQDLSKNTIENVLTKELIEFEQAYMLTNLLWTQAETLSKLNQQQESMIQYENALQILRWKAKQPFEKSHIERENKIRELEIVISAMKKEKK